MWRGLPRIAIRKRLDLLSQWIPLGTAQSAPGRVTRPLGNKFNFHPKRGVAQRVSFAPSPKGRPEGLHTHMFSVKRVSRDLSDSWTLGLLHQESSLRRS